MARAAKKESSDLSAEPDVSVVVIAFNDAARLPRAVASVLQQTLARVEVIVVDDASTDGTGGVADALAAAHPDRVRAVHLPTNSGGCSRPRNAGLEVARGDYVMFLDSDDELDPDACRVLWEAVTQEDADFSAGLCVRVYHRQYGRRGPWKPELYAQRKVAEGLAAMPELLNDSLSTNKCWRRSFLSSHGLVFPEGMHFEDLVFTAQAYVAARRFVLVPQPVYVWHVEDDPERTSITNRRAELSNLRDRLAAHRYIDELLVAPELKLAKDVKFVRHDLRLYVNDFLGGEDSWRQVALDLICPYLATLDPAAPTEAGRMHGIEVFALEHRDVPLVLSTVRHLRHGGKVSVPLVVRGDRAYWGGDHLDTEEGRAALDVTDLRLHVRPHHAFPYFHQVTGLRRDGDDVRIEGTTLNQLGRLDSATLALRLTPRLRIGTVRTYPLGDVVADGDLLRWSATVDLSGTFRPLGLVDDLYRVSVRTVADGEANESPLTLDPDVGDRPDIPVRPRLSRLVASHARPFTSGHGNLELRLVALTPASKTVRRVLAAERAEGVVRRLRYRLLARRAARG